MRVFVIGDSITFGTGDHEGFGWIGRLPTIEDVSYFNLGVPGHTIGQMLDRAHFEVKARMVPYHESVIILSGGLNDLSLDEHLKTRTDGDQLLAEMDALVDAMRHMAPTLVLGPTPIEESYNPYFSNALGKEVNYKNVVIAQYDENFAGICKSRSVPYLSLYQALKDDASFQQSLKDSDGIHPDHMGYVAIADYVSNWNAFRRKLPNDK